MATGNFDWDAGEYDAVARVQERWGRELIARIEWSGEESVLDAGCGSGQLLPYLAEKIPHGRLTCLDRDGGMIEAARQRIRALKLAIPADAVLGDIAALEMTPLRPASFDVVFSNAALHWVPDKLRAFAGFSRLLKPGGRVVAQYGGEKNIQRIRAALYRVLRDLGAAAAQERWSFQSVEQTKEQLKTCGFRDVRVWENEAPATFPDRAAFARFCTAVILRSYQSQLPPPQWEALQARFPDVARELLGGWRVDYVRQNLEARR